ncbi:MAG: DUF6079 family protein [bacterium]|nr:DUF6079 family protein [bacterium]
MKYRDLISFEPIDSVKVLRDAEDLEAARLDVETMVVSPRLAEQLIEVILPNLDLDTAPDAKGMLVVANYGTGKTHLMSVVSSILEHADLVELVQSKEVQTAAAPVAGRYRVIRAEIGATTMGLRDIITTELTDGLRRLGVDFEFPDLSQVTNTKRSLEEMMAAFEAVHGDQGLLFVLDEMLDYLASRRDNELRVDLAVLREIGEICKSTRFRFIGGVQEAIFDNPRFASAADAVIRVRERFTQMRISREDIAFVVERRLLRKTPEQKAKIRGHLQPFAPAYEGMAESLETFVSLYPVHPAYLRIFELVTLVEKRKVLTTLSDEMRGILDTDVPESDPGLICYDTYRAQLETDPSNRAIPEVREVLDKAQVLKTRVDSALPTPEYVSTAQRIVDALAVHRLTTGDINTPIGPSCSELRDDLTLLPPDLPEMDSFFLETTVESIIDDIIRAVSGQFITRNEENGQVYLDVLKDIDYDQRIEERAASLDDGRLDEAYFRALETVLEQRDNPYVAGYRIWAYELNWTPKHVTRSGYLFMGAPNERSTAQPPRDFYVYFLQPYDPPKFTDEEKPDEVFFRLVFLDEKFTDALRHYAGAVALWGESTGQHRTVYADKLQKHLQEMVAWLREHMGEAVTVTYRGETQPLASALASSQGPRTTVKEQIDSIAATALALHFDDRYPDYPPFGVQVTQANLAENLKQALRQVVTTQSNLLGSKVLAALGLVDVQGNLVEDGPFAAQILEQVSNGAGQAVNRSEFFTERDPGVFTWGPWHLEPCWFVVVAATLTQLGRLEIGFKGGQIDALGLSGLLNMDLEEIESVTHVAPPKELPITVLKEAVQLVDISAGNVSASGAREELVQHVATRCIEYAGRIARVRASLSDGINVWGAEVLEHQTERSTSLRDFEDAVNNLKARNTVGKLNKLDLTTEQIALAADGKVVLKWIEDAADLAAHLSDVTAYLREAVEAFGSDNPISADAAMLRSDVLEMFRSEASFDMGQAGALKTSGEELRQRFAAEAVAAHNRDRLDGAGDERKRRIFEGATYRNLTRLSTIELLPGGRHATLQQKLTDLRTCKTFDPNTLARNVACPECGYRPRSADSATASARLQQIEEEIHSLHTEWEKALLDSLAVPEMTEQIALLGDAEKLIVENFLASRSFPEPVTEEFVRAVKQVLNRFEVRPISPRSIWETLFPESVPATPAELRGRFIGLLEQLGEGSTEERIRFVPRDEDAQ